MKPTLSQSVLAGSNRLSLLQQVLLAVAGSLLLWVSAKVQVPFWPVPMTMQTFVVLGLGAAFGWRLGMATVALYCSKGRLACRFSQAPRKKASALPTWLARPVAILQALCLPPALPAGWLKSGFDRNVLTMGLAMLAGTVAIYALGLGWLGALIGYEKAIQFGLVPFIPGDIAKLVLAAIVFPAAWTWLKRNG
jgi:biotin transport system substrate-specific component